MPRVTQATLLVLLCSAARGGTAERFLVYKVERINPAQAPTMDGALTDAVWQDKATITTLRNFRGPLEGEFATQRSEFILLTDGAKLYVGATFREESMATIRCNPALDPFWNDCFELYFDPRHDGTRHIQLVVDCGGQRFWHKRFDDGYGWWADSAWHTLAQWQSAVAREARAWTVEIALDCASFGIDPAPGKVCGFNACRFRFAVPEKDEFSAWGFDPDGARQQAITHWGHLIFGAPGERQKGAGVTRRDIALVYPSLADRTLEIPLDDGFLVYTGKDEKHIAFPEILKPLAAAAAAAEEQARASLDVLSRENAHRAGLLKRLDTLSADLAKLQASLATGTITLGTCDRLAQGFRRSRDGLEELNWTGKIARLAATP